MELADSLKLKKKRALRRGILPLGERPGRILSRVMWALGPVVGFTMVEYLNYNTYRSFSALQLVLNLAFYYIIAGVVYLLVGRRNLSCGISTALFWAIGMANHYVISFRGRTIFPGDLLGLQTAFNVSGNYSYALDTRQMVTLAGLAVFLLILILLPIQRGRAKLRLRSILPASLAGAAFLAVFFCTGFLSWVGVQPSMWTTIGNGFVLNFSVCLKYSAVQEPDGYSQDALSTIRSSVEEKGNPASGVGAGDTRPVNVIAIMNESFSDLSTVCNFPVNKDCLPFWRSLTENTVRGYAYSSVFGGTTANSEFEFLTGNSTAFTPAGTVPYQMYVKEGAASLVAQMNALGYTSIAAHPYLSSGWNRPAVYANFGFSQVLFQEDFQDVERYRGYITDQTNYENLVRLYEEKEKGEKLFLFNVTMQNHSGYDVPWTTLPREVKLSGSLSGRYPSVDQYLSLIYQSDKAFEYLVNYFSQVEEPTIILMFGDHQPQVSGGFYNRLLGTDPELEDLQEKYKIPFLLWANYDIEERDGVETSINYLSTLLMETANLPRTGYQQFLSELRQLVPALNANGYLDAQGNWHERVSAMDAAAQAALSKYRMLQYNELFDDRQNRLQDFFFLPEKTGQ